MKKTGNRVAGLAVQLVVVAMVASPVMAQKASQATAMVAGSVFRDTGFSLPGAEVTVAVKAARKKEWKVVTDARGEFVARVPAGPGEYLVTVKAKGYKPAEKNVTIAGDERVDLSLILEPEGGGKK